MKKLMYLIPNILLALYVICYIPILNLIISYNEKSSEMIAPFQANNTMDMISLIFVIITIILKIIFNAKKCEISKKESIINGIVFAVLLVILFLFKGLTAFA